MVQLTESETATVLQALRLHQKRDMCKQQAEGIDDLCEKINCDDDDDQIVIPDDPRLIFGLPMLSRIWKADEFKLRGERELEACTNKLLATAILLEVDEFWELCNKLIEEWKCAEKTRDAKLVCEWFLWGSFFGEAQKPVTAVRFVKTYGAMVLALRKSLLNVVAGCGDDAFRDLCDSFPMWGRNRYELARSGKIEGASDKQSGGENCFYRHLKEELQKNLSKKAADWLGEQQGLYQPAACSCHSVGRG